MIALVEAADTYRAPKVRQCLHIPLREAEEDYSLPSYVPDLFGDQDGEPE